MRLGVKFGLFVLLFLAACGQNCPPPPEKEVIPPLTPIVEGEPNLMGYRLVTTQSATVGELWTNLEYGGRPQKAVIRIPVPVPIYDVSYVVYSKKFSDRYGYPNTHVSELSDGLHLMEFRMENRGAYAKCSLNMLIDKGQGHFLEGRPFYYSVFPVVGHFSLPIKLPQRNVQFKDSQEDINFRVKYRQKNPIWGSDIGLHKAFLAARNYKGDEWGSILSSDVEIYHAFMFEEYDYFSIQTGCTELPAHIFLTEDSMLWVQKKNHTGDPVTSEESRKDVLRYKIPQELKDKMRPLLEKFPITYQIWKKASEEAFNIIY